MNRHLLAAVLALLVLVACGGPTFTGTRAEVRFSAKENTITTSLDGALVATVHASTPIPIVVRCPEGDVPFFRADGRTVTCVPFPCPAGHPPVFHADPTSVRVSCEE